MGFIYCTGCGLRLNSVFIDSMCQNCATKYENASGVDCTSYIEVVIKAENTSKIKLSEIEKRDDHSDECIIISNHERASFIKAVRAAKAFDDKLDTYCRKEMVEMQKALSAFDFEDE